MNHSALIVWNQLDRLNEQVETNMKTLNWVQKNFYIDSIKTDEEETEALLAQNHFVKLSRKEQLDLNYKLVKMSQRRVNLQSRGLP